MDIHRCTSLDATPRRRRVGAPTMPSNSQCSKHLGKEGVAFGFSSYLKNVFKKTNALSKCKLAKFRKVSNSVWVCLKAVITEKTIKQE